jgi:hypothetical protein
MKEKCVPVEVPRKLVANLNLTNQSYIFINMLKPVNDIYKQKSHKVENVVKKNGHSAEAPKKATLDRSR